MLLDYIRSCLYDKGIAASQPITLLPPLVNLPGSGYVKTSKKNIARRGRLAAVWCFISQIGRRYIMERTQQDWFSIFDHQRRIMVERLELLFKFEQFLLTLPDGAYTAEQRAVMVTDISHAKDSIAYLEQCQQEAAEEKLKLGLSGFVPKRQKKSRNRNH